MTTLTVSRNALMAVRLAEAFEKAGIKYYGKIDPNRINPEEYENLSPREMVAKYSKEHHVEQINVYLDILKENFRCNRKNDSFPMRVKLDKHKIDFFQFTIALQYLKLAEKVGERAQTRYIWHSENTPLYSDAEQLFHYIQKMKDYQLEPKAKKFIETNVSMGMEKLNEQLNPDNTGERYYQIHRYLCYARTKINQKVKKHHEVFETEVGRDQMVHQEDLPVSTPKEKLDMILILNTRIKQQDKHIKHLRKYIRQLEKSIVKLQ